ncbi:MAG: hypothetical protein GX542_12465 [Rhodococcus sp.]|nr:hypothetical protein [Rhodococcus sp. (in: high G+C Gram-positive bacteria)]
MNHGQKPGKKDLDHWFPAFETPPTPQDNTDAQASPGRTPAQATPPPAGGHAIRHSGPRPSQRATGFDPFADNSDAPTWLDDAAAAPARAPKAPSRLGRNLAIVGGGLVLAGAIAAGVAFMVMQTNNSSDAVASTSTTEAATSANNLSSDTATDEWCSRFDEGARRGGDGDGDHSSGLNAIFAFQHAYYVERDGFKVAEFGEPGRFSGEAIHDGIANGIPVGLRHCLDVTTTGPGTYSMVLQTREDGKTGIGTVEYVVTTVEVDGLHYVQGFH